MSASSPIDPNARVQWTPAQPTSLTNAILAKIETLSKKLDDFNQQKQTTSREVKDLDKETLKAQGELRRAKLSSLKEFDKDKYEKIQRNTDSIQELGMDKMHIRASKEENSAKKAGLLFGGFVAGFLGNTVLLPLTYVAKKVYEYTQKEELYQARENKITTLQKNIASFGAEKENKLNQLQKAEKEIKNEFNELTSHKFTNVRDKTTADNMTAQVKKIQVTVQQISINIEQR